MKLPQTNIRVGPLDKAVVFEGHLRIPCLLLSTYSYMDVTQTGPVGHLFWCVISVLLGGMQNEDDWVKVRGEDLLKSTSREDVCAFKATITKWRALKPKTTSPKCSISRP